MSARVKVSCEVRVYENNGVEGRPHLAIPLMTVDSHWNRDNLAVITIPGFEQTITVERRDLIVALENVGRTNG